MKRTAALAAALALCLALFLSPARAVGDVCFTAVNDNLIPLAGDSMPAWVGGELYVPASVFDHNANGTGVSLGFYCSHSRNSGTVTLYNLRQMLVFDINAGNSRNQHTGEVFADRAVTRNGRVYLPLAAVCRFFGLEYSYNYTEYGYLVRIKNESVVLSDAAFIDAAGNLMSSRLREYNQSLTPDDPQDPGISDQPGTPDPPPAGVNVQVCLAFRCETGQALEQVLSALDEAGKTGLFLFPPQELATRDDLVRRCVCSGHCVGLLAQGESEEQTRALLEQGEGLLGHVARMETSTALVTPGQEELFQAEGWTCWRESMSALPQEGESASACAARLIRQIGTRQRTVYLTLDDGEETARVLPTLLRQLEREQYTIQTPLETRL